MINHRLKGNTKLAQPCNAVNKRTCLQQIQAASQLPAQHNKVEPTVPLAALLHESRINTLSNSITTVENHCKPPWGSSRTSQGLPKSSPCVTV
jgi:hypothetical protein